MIVKGTLETCNEYSKILGGGGAMTILTSKVANVYVVTSRVAEKCDAIVLYSITKYSCGTFS